ncbi:dihydrofolate reductase family protein [Micromonospora phytophila]|uniref:dihydrofolate reductase family protein n=1 Tax=Micromonospora phytophila TaxID=709888 RepID=UPI00202F118A|nr:dihydrofolate reductase family protein [Micromonospora phytophila]MCM0676660.1 dihydrofolate reductase family protein [Micromonospora phytophila]
MGRIVYYVHQSLDGFIEGPNGEFDWPAMGPELSAYSFGLNDRTSAFLYGRRVWEMMSYYWPRAESISDHPHDLAFAPVWRRTPKVVVSRTLTGAEHGARVIGRGDLAEEITALKREAGGDLLLTGGADLAGALTGLGLIDEYHLVVHPVVLGGGKPVFTAKDRFDLGLVATRSFDSRAVLLRYDRVAD